MKHFLLISLLTVAPTTLAQQPVEAERSFARECGMQVDLMSSARPTLIDGHDYGWEDWGEGSIYDGWFTTIWRDDDNNRINPADYMMKCAFQRSTTPEGYVRIVEPWCSPTGWFGCVAGRCERGRDLIIDMTDPRLVIIMPQFTGIVRQHPVSKTPIEYVVLNYEGYALFFKDDPDGAVEVNEMHPDLATTYANGEIHIQTPMWTVVNVGDEIEEDDLGGANAPEAVIYLPGTQGVQDVMISDTSCKAEFYNLQGQRVAEPTRGCYIRRTANGAEKVFVK